MQKNFFKTRKPSNNISVQKRWRDNIALLFAKRNEIIDNQRLTISEDNFSYLQTISDFIKERTGKYSFECQFVEKPDHRIQNMPSAGLAS